MLTATPMPIPATASSEERAFWEASFWEAVRGRDGRMDGVFYYAVATTGVYCRPSCPSRQPKRENVAFFADPAKAERAGYRACLRCKPAESRALDPQADIAVRICRYLAANLEETVSLERLGREFQMSPFHLQRVFRSVTGVSPRQYAEFCRVDAFKKSLRAGRGVTEAIYDAGYGSSSRLYERSAAHLGMTPASYRKGAEGVRIRFAIVDSPVGAMLIAATAQGVCSIQFGESAAELEAKLRAEFFAAELQPAGRDFRVWINQVLDHLRGAVPHVDLPFDIRATAFQRRVWEHLRTIPRGATQTYAEVARAIGQPRAARAVARACASNAVALAIPCHRVVRGDGDPGGYKWGAERKQALLRLEKR